VLAAARHLFTAHGFGATSMDAVAARADVGKATVYAHFGSKEELFAAVIESEGRAHSVALGAPRGEAVASVLERFGFDAFDLLLSPTTIAVFRAVAAEAGRFPDLGRLFFTRGPAILIDRFARYLGEAMDKGELRRAPPRQAATQFFGMICGDEQVRALLGVGRTISRKERKALVKGGVDAFLRAYRPGEAC
jgi:AcrR family transcriptional regulator